MISRMLMIVVSRMLKDFKNVEILNNVEVVSRMLR